MKFEGTRTCGWEPAIIGMRLPLCKDYSDAKSKCDSVFYESGEPLSIGESDMKVIKNLISADKVEGKVGQPNSKFLQMIEIWVAIEAPLAFWKEFDTYRNMVKLSTSTMHRIQKYPISYDCFEPKPDGNYSNIIDIEKLEAARIKYNETRDKSVWYDLIYGLPDSWLQTRMCHFNYATLQNMICWRSNHRQNCWSGIDNSEMANFMGWAKNLPFVNELFLGESDDK